MKALTFSSFGTTEVLEYTDVPKPRIADGEVLIEMKAIGLNYADVYRRKGFYHLEGKPPYIAGYEGAGIVKKSNSKRFNPGERVGFADVPFANAEYVKSNEDNLIRLPDEIDFNIAASILLQGLTAQYLASDSFDVKEGDVVLIHSAAGGVGQILTQICKLKKAVVIGLTRSKVKLKTIKDNNADFAFLLDNDWKKKVMEITNNTGVDVVYDSIGTTLRDSFDVAKIKGTVVFYGMSGGKPPSIDPLYLMDTSKRLAGDDLWNYLSSFEEREKRAKQLFEWIINKNIKLKPPKEFKLAEGRIAHEYLESGKSSGKIILIP